MMSSGSTDSTKCVLVAKPTRSQALCSRCLRKHSCLCNACIVTRKHQSELKHQQGAQRKWLVDAFSWPEAALMWHHAAVGSNGVTAPGLRYGFQKQIWTTHSQRNLGIKKDCWLMFSTCLTPSHGNQQPLHTRLSHPALSGSNFCILPTVVPGPPAPTNTCQSLTDFWSPKRRWEGRASSSERLWLDKKWCLTGLTARASHRKTHRDWSIK